MTNRPSLFSFETATVEGTTRPRLDAVTVEIPATGVTVLAGPSAAGKTTMLRLCNRLEVPSDGTVSFRAIDLNDLDPLQFRRRVGMVFQRPVLFPGTVQDNLAEAGGDEALWERCLGQAGLDSSLLDRDADELSGGEAQRACLARTLVTEPEGLLLDEPTSSLDLTATLSLETQVHRLAGAGVPIVWVTHDLGQLRRLADHVIVLVDGTVHFAGRADDLDNTADHIVGAFLAGELDAG